MSDTTASSAAPSRSMRVLVAGAAATVVVGFIVGFALGGRSTDAGEGLSAAGTTPSTSTAPSTTVGSTTTTAAPASSSTTAVTSTSTTSTTALVTTTAAPTTSVVVPFPTIPTTVAPPTTVATVTPSRVVVYHATDGSGRLTIPRSGSANLVITNEGGLGQQWLVTGTGFSTVGASQGTLGPGQTANVTVIAPPGELPSGEINGIVSVLGAVNPTVAFVIPAA